MIKAINLTKRTKLIKVCIKKNYSADFKLCEILEIGQNKVIHT